MELVSVKGRFIYFFSFAAFQIRVKESFLELEKYTLKNPVLVTWVRHRNERRRKRTFCLTHSRSDCVRYPPPQPIRLFSSSQSPICCVGRCIFHCLPFFFTCEQDIRRLGAHPIKAFKAPPLKKPAPISSPPKAAKPKSVKMSQKLEMPGFGTEWVDKKGRCWYFLP